MAVSKIGNTKVTPRHVHESAYTTFCGSAREKAGLNGTINYVIE